MDIKAIGKLAEYKQDDNEEVKSLAFSRSGRLLFTIGKGTATGKIISSYIRLYNKTGLQNNAKTRRNINSECVALIFIIVF